MLSQPRLKWPRQGSEHEKQRPLLLPLPSFLSTLAPAWSVHIPALRSRIATHPRSLYRRIS